MLLQVTPIATGAAYQPREPGGEKWYGIVGSPDGKTLYAAPYNAPSVLVIDAARKTASGIDSTAVHIGDGKWSGVAIGSGRLFAVPWNAPSVLMMELSTQQMTGLPVDNGRKFFTTFGPGMYCQPSRPPPEKSIIEGRRNSV